MTRPIIATIPIMAAAIIAAIVAPVVPAVIVAVLIMGVTVMAIARLRLTRHGGHGAHTEKRRQGQFLQEHRSTRSEEHTSELQSLMRISYAVFCLTKKKKYNNKRNTHSTL